MLCFGLLSFIPGSIYIPQNPVIISRRRSHLKFIEVLSLIVERGCHFRLVGCQFVNMMNGSPCIPLSRRYSNLVNPYTAGRVIGSGMIVETYQYVCCRAIFVDGRSLGPVWTVWTS